MSKLASETIKKPALGIMPREFHINHRIKAIEEAIVRFNGAEQTIPIEWYEELVELIKMREKWQYGK